MFDTRELSRLKEVEDYTMRKAAAFEIIALNKPIADLDVNKLKAIVNYNKRENYGAVPITKKYLLERYDATCCRADQTLETYLSSVGRQ